MIEIEELTKRYKNGQTELIVLDKVTLQIDFSEMVALTGPSGAGKSTLMHLIGCLDLPSSGAYALNGQNVSELTFGELAKIRNQSIGFVFQQFHLLADLSALENVMLPMLYGQKHEKEAREKAKELLEHVGLEQRLNHHPQQLSGGQKQRVAIARALAMDPSILLADEPTGSLDSHHAQLILDLFKEINRLKGTSIIIVTHDREIASQMPRTITLRDGKIYSDTRVK